ncbi:MAG: UDP-N-acetylmuramoyl-L-alanine--D-glutamate ligase [Candidatus Andersenbacteria bacterium]
MTPLSQLAGKRVTVMGLGLHGGALGTIRWLHEQGANITVTDLQSEQGLATTVAQLKDIPNITWVLGRHRDEDFTDADLVIRNPAVRRDSQYLALATAHHVPIEMDSSLFFKYSPTENIIGITGSKGKSTTTHAISHLLQVKYPQAVTVGIDGASPLGKLADVTKDCVVVFELSSWRLEALDKMGVSPHTAVVTSIYEDHLNTYSSFAEYIETKKSIFRHQDPTDRVILNADDAIIRKWTGELTSDVFWYSLGSKLPTQYGIYVKRGVITIRIRSGTVSLFPLSRLQLKSEHERRNVLPAILLGFLGGIPIDSIELNIRNLKGLAHRLEKVRVMNSVTYINDSAATMPDATIAAVKALNKKHLVLILGGNDKRLRFENLAVALAQARVRGIVFLPGTATDRLERQIRGAYGTPPQMVPAASMPEAVATATELARPGDVVLLSPGATSFGLFQHEFHRGDVFKSAVQAL